MLRNLAMDALVALIGDLEAAEAAGRTDEELALARKLQRQAQFRLDFVEAENSTGFHAPGGGADPRGVDRPAREGQLAVRDAGYQPSFVNEIASCGRRRASVARRDHGRAGRSGPASCCAIRRWMPSSR